MAEEGQLYAMELQGTFNLYCSNTGSERIGTADL